MTPNIPFPSTLAAISAASGRRLQSSDKDDAGHLRPKGPEVRDYIGADIAAYRLPDGRQIPAYDMYKPTAPEGAEPGLARIRYKARHYPNDTQGYEAEILDFKSIEDLQAGGLAVDMTAAGLLIRENRPAQVLAAACHEDLLFLHTILESGAELKTGPIEIVGPPGPLEAFSAIYTRGAGLSIVAAADRDSLANWMRERYKFIEGIDDADTEATFAMVAERGHEYGWIVAEASFDEGLEAAADLILDDACRPG